ncbi:MAG: hypothetical protein MRY64_04850 [Hyphomonadaceae bacterium]|nr:hypothetical protein [Hyphomonadaceae bacterium]
MSDEDPAPDKASTVPQTALEPTQQAPAPAPVARPDPPPPTAPQAKRKIPDLEIDPGPARRGKEKPAKRPLLWRIFGVSIWGVIKLLIVCILIGSVLMLVEETQRATQENLANATADAARQLWAGTVWAVKNFWQPALYGAGVVLPVWTLWRIVSLPFRK